MSGAAAEERRDAEGRVIDFDPDALLKRIGGERIEVQRISGGQSNPTYFITVDGRRLVLRKQPSGELLPSAHLVDREYRVMHALRGSGVPVPKMELLEEDKSVLGAAFYIMERIEGRVVHDSALPGFAPEERTAAYLDYARTLAALHSVDYKAVGLGDFGREGGYLARQIARWTKQWRLSQTRDDANMEELATWLAANVPADDPTTVVHGDYRIGNVMFAPVEPKLAAVLDWELATLGHPLSDVAHLSTFWAFEPEMLGGVKGLDLKALGIPERDRFVDAYREAGGYAGEISAFHDAYALFRFAAIFEGIAARVKSGSAAGEDAEKVGGYSADCAIKAMEALSRDRH